MTRQEFTDAVAEVLGIHAMEWRIETIVLLADAYARTPDRPAARVPLTLTGKGQRAVALLDAYEGQQEPGASDA